MNIAFYLLITCCLVFIIVNLLLKIRANTNSNKIVENFINRSFLKKILSVKKRGWQIYTFKSNQKLETLSNSTIEKASWFYLKDKECSGIADPFIYKNSGKYYLFFEYEYHKYLKKGADLAYASSEDGVHWKFEKKILEEPFHQSFPYVFEEQGETYMLPESFESNQVRLYKSVDFPYKWQLDSVLFEGLPMVDTVFYKKDNVYYWFTTNLNTDTLELYFSEGFKSEWIQHPASPISQNVKNNRNAGAIIVENQKIYRLAQDATMGYGSGVNLYEIEQLDKIFYKESVVKEPLLFKKDKGIKDAVHHVSIMENSEEKIFAIDGANFAVNAIKLF